MPTDDHDAAGGGAKYSASRARHLLKDISSPIGLLFDLSVAVSLAVAAFNFGYYGRSYALFPSAIGMIIAVVLILWAWIQHSWYSSTHDSHGLLPRAGVMIQVVGVILAGMGINPLIQSQAVYGQLMGVSFIAGYVTMRLGQAFLWWLLARASTGEEKQGALRQALGTSFLAAMWGVLYMTAPHFSFITVGTLILLVAEWWLSPVTNPSFRAFKLDTASFTHRFSLLTLVSIGAPMVASLMFSVELSISVVVDATAALVTLGVIILTVGLWWMYELVPAAEAIKINPEKSRVYALAHIPLYVLIVAISGSVFIASNTIRYVWGIAEFGAGLISWLVIPVALASITTIILRPISAGEKRPRAWDLLLLGSSMIVLLVAIGVSTADSGFGLAVLLTGVSTWVVVAGNELSDTTFARGVTGRLVSPDQNAEGTPKDDSHVSGPEEIQPGDET